MLKGMIKRALQPAVRTYRKQATLRNIVALEKSDHPYASALASAIKDTLIGNLDNEETQWISRIEARRLELLSNDAPISFLDYGAGSGKSKNTLEQSINGVRSKTTISKVTKASKSQLHATLLFKLIRNLKPSHCLELGTCVGISAAYQAAGLALNQSGNLVTLEGADEIAEIARSTFKILDLQNVEVIEGPFYATLDKALTKQKPIQFFFNDGHHDGVAVKKYFDTALPYLDNIAVIFLDDIRWSSSMFEAWDFLRQDQRAAISIDFGSTGLLVMDGNFGKKEIYDLKI